MTAPSCILVFLCLVHHKYAGSLSCNQTLPALQVQDTSKEGRAKRQRDAYSGPHTVWDSFTELGGEAAAARSDEQVQDLIVLRESSKVHITFQAELRKFRDVVS